MLARDPSTHEYSPVDAADDGVPSSNEIIILWRIFLARVDSVAGKIIHVPSFRSVIVDAAAGFRNVSPHTKGLLFAVFLTASLALSRQEHLELLGRRKEHTMAAYSGRLKSTLTQYGYLRNYNLDTLKTLALYSVGATLNSVFTAYPLLNMIAVCPENIPRDRRSMGLQRPARHRRASPRSAL